MCVHKLIAFFANSGEFSRIDMKNQEKEITTGNLNSRIHRDIEGEM